MGDDAQSGVHTVTMADMPFEAIREHWRSLPTWPPHFAVAWVAQPTWEEIVAQARRQTGGPGMREASEAVLAALIDGRLIAYGMREDGSMGRKAPEKIRPDEWEDLIWMGGTLAAPALNKHTGRETFRDVQIDRLGLFRLWPGIARQTEPRTTTAPTVEPIEPTSDVKPTQTVQMAQSKKASATELHDFLQSIEARKLTRDEVFVLQKAHFGPRALGKRTVFAAYADGSYRFPRLPGERAGK